MSTKRSLRLALLVVLTLAATACHPRIYDFAGTNTVDVPGAGTPYLAAHTVLAMDDEEALFGLQQFYRNDRVRSIDLATGAVTPRIGTGHWGVLGDGGPAVDAHLLGPAGMDRDAAGNIYLAESRAGRVRKVAPDGTISTVAGTPPTEAEFLAVPWSTFGSFSGDGFSATSAQMYKPVDVAADVDGDLYVADMGNSRVRRVSAVDGTIDTVIGGGALDPANGLGGEQIRLVPLGLAVDPAGDLLVTTSWHQVLRWDPDTDSIAVVAGLPGTSNGAFYGDGGPATAARFDFVEELSVSDGVYMMGGIDVAADGTVYVADSGNERVRAFVPGGNVNTLAGGGFGDVPGPAGGAFLPVPTDVSVTPSGRVLIADIARVTALETDGWLTLLAGHNETPPEPEGDGGPAAQAPLRFPYGLDFAADGTAYFTENDRWLRSVSPAGVLDTIVGGGGPVGGIGALALSGTGTVWVAGLPYGAIEERNLTTGAVIRTLSIGGSDLAVDPVTHHLYVADNTRVWRVNPATGAATLYAGSGAGPLGDGGPATSATLKQAAGLAVHPVTRDLYIADRVDHRVRRVNRTTGVITTVAGTGVGAHTGDGGPATAAGVRAPLDLAFTSTGTLYVLEAPATPSFVGGQNGGQIRRMTVGGNIDNYAGNGTPSGGSPSGSIAPQSKLGNVSQLAVNPLNDELYFVDTGDNKIRRIALPPPPPPG